MSHLIALFYTAVSWGDLNFIKHWTVARGPTLWSFRSRFEGGLSIVQASGQGRTVSDTVSAMKALMVELHHHVKKMIIFGVCESETLRGTSFLRLAGECECFCSFLKGMNHWHLCREGRKNRVKRGKSLISPSIPLAGVLFHLIEMGLCACRRCGATKGIGMFQSPSRFHQFSTNVGWINC